jgi:hypothetical protein
MTRRKKIEESKDEGIVTNSFDLSCLDKIVLPEGVTKAILVKTLLKLGHGNSGAFEISDFNNVARSSGLSYLFNILLKNGIIQRAVSNNGVKTFYTLNEEAYRALNNIINTKEP